MSEEARPEDDGFHSPSSDDPFWSETSWYGFAVPERGLAGTIYPLFRPNLGVCSVAVYVWDERAVEPWLVPYGRSLWHVSMPDGDLTEMTTQGLTYRCEKPLSTYRVQYEDGDRLRLDLRFEGLIAPHAPMLGADRGHIDQPCRVTGSLELAGETIPVDGYEMRDRSWGVRDDRRTTRASYSYAIASESDCFLAGGFYAQDTCHIVTGFLLRDGEKADLVRGTRRVIERENGYPVRVVVEAEDALSRQVVAEGRCTSRLANQATPGMFAWLSLADWSFGEARGFGQDQDVWSPDLLGG